MSDEQALLGAIRDHPDEDTPRLMYADWLGEHAADGAERGRGTFIRVECELAGLRARPNRGTDRYQTLATHSSNRFGAAGTGALAGCGLTNRLRYLSLGFNVLGDLGALALARSPHFAALEELFLSSVGMSDEGADAVAAAPWAGQLQTLFLSFNSITPRKQAELTRQFGEILWIDGVVGEDN
jgi:uncharacterized protein (TIGR02996 family)